MSSSRVHTFYVTRHGETVGNVARVVFPPEEDVVSPNGLKEAELLGKAFKDVNFTKVYSSPYARAVTTTEVILNNNNLSGNSFEQDDRLREICVGKYEGGQYAPLFKDILQFLHKGVSKYEWTVDQAETLGQIESRAKSFMEDLVKELDASDKDETILMVCHGGFNMAFFEMLNKYPDIVIANWDDSCGKIMRNATYMKFTLSSKGPEDSKRKMTFFNIHEKSHLKEMNKVDSLTTMSQTPEGKPISGCFQV